MSLPIQWAWAADKKDAPKAGDGNAYQGQSFYIPHKKDAPKAGDGNCNETNIFVIIVK